MVKFLHDLRIKILNYVATENVIVRLEVNDNIDIGELELIVFVKDKYYPFLLNQVDLDQPDLTLDFIMRRLRSENIKEKN